MTKSFIHKWFIEIYPRILCIYMGRSSSLLFMCSSKFCGFSDLYVSCHSLPFDLTWTKVAKNVGRIFANLVGRVWSLLLGVTVLFDFYLGTNYVQAHLHIVTRPSSSAKLQRHKASVWATTQKLARLEKIVITAARRLSNIVVVFTWHEVRDW